MEFNVLPHAKILSPSNRSVSGALAKSDNNANQSNSQTVNVVLANKGGDEPSVSISTQQLPIKEPQPEPVPKIDPESFKEPSQDPIAVIKFLQLVLQSYIDNPIRYNGLIICTVDLLKQLIQTLTGCDEVTIELEDIEVECCKQSKIQPINKIWCRKDDSAEIFKYKYSNLLQIFESYRISLKFIYIDQ